MAGAVCRCSGNGFRIKILEDYHGKTDGQLLRCCRTPRPLHSAPRRASPRCETHVLPETESPRPCAPARASPCGRLLVPCALAGVARVRPPAPSPAKPLLLLGAPLSPSSVLPWCFELLKDFFLKFYLYVLYTFLSSAKVK